MPCYYDSEVEPDICDPEGIEPLKKQQLIRIDDGDYFLILIPSKGGDEWLIGEEQEELRNAEKKLRRKEE